ncbi:hypothetical protein KG088_17885 [Halomonas sp. TRM85114]|uniref:hypothetical protein n=1 Tax=Halomonas jincaotanensis TaxID=2810616 RepID=UPI001BD5A825|nr:hypothetical protein [Halomonas jincaotanensis]MBS9405478.1 hypothetical protein [Halomonas jincaotanensis]
MLHAFLQRCKGADWPGLKNVKEEKMQPQSFTFNNLAQQRAPSEQWLFWIIVFWIITADDDRERERKRRLARQQQQREDDEQRARRKRPPAPKPPTP